METSTTAGANATRLGSCSSPTSGKGRNCLSHKNHQYSRICRHSHHQIRRRRFIDYRYHEGEQEYKYSCCHNGIISLLDIGESYEGYKKCSCGDNGNHTSNKPINQRVLRDLIRTTEERVSFGVRLRVLVYAFHTLWRILCSVLAENSHRHQPHFVVSGACVAPFQ